MAEYIEREATLYRMKVDIAPPLKVVSEMPAADVAPVRHGRWIIIESDEEQFFLCSECENKEYWESNFCPSCGAKMDGGGDG